VLFRSWELTIGRKGAQLTKREAEQTIALASQEWEQAPTEVQVLDSGTEITILGDSRLLFSQRFEADPLGIVGGFGVVESASDSEPVVISCEGLPRQWSLPSDMVMPLPWQPPASVVVLRDSLTGQSGDVMGRRPENSNVSWHRLLGDGHLVVSGSSGARWQASVELPLSGRTLYTLPWDEKDFVDLSVTLTPPGSGRGQSEHGTAGFCLWQDADNHLLINTWLDDCYGGASLSSFSTIDGFEDLYDAIWTNVGERISWGKPIRMRLVSDGLHYLVSIDGEPVLYRALSDIYPGCPPLRINQIGLLGNWEWGADTGSQFRDFLASGRPKS